MQRKDILIKGWDFAIDIEGWYPPLKAALEGVNPQHAHWKPEGEASHSIGELVIHLLYYKKRFLYRLEQKDWTIDINSNDETFQNATYATPGAWPGLVNELQSVNISIREKLSGLEDQDLDKVLPKDPIGGQILDLIMHDAYHTGQIILIRKLQGSWPSKRDV